MTDSELNALLDAHDALVAACVEERLTLVEFLAAYNDFPRVYGLDGRAAGADERLSLRRATLMRLRQLIARYPDFKALPDTSLGAAIYSV